jgi:hypothetical protein
MIVLLIQLLVLAAIMGILLREPCHVILRSLRNRAHLVIVCNNCFQLWNRRFVSLLCCSPFHFHIQFANKPLSCSKSNILYPILSYPRTTKAMAVPKIPVIVTAVWVVAPKDDIPPLFGSSTAFMAIISGVYSETGQDWRS